MSPTLALAIQLLFLHITLQWYPIKLLCGLRSCSFVFSDNSSLILIAILFSTLNLLVALLTFFILPQLWTLLDIEMNEAQSHESTSVEPNKSFVLPWVET